MFEPASRQNVTIRRVRVRGVDSRQSPAACAVRGLEGQDGGAGGGATRLTECRPPRMGMFSNKGLFFAKSTPVGLIRRLANLRVARYSPQVNSGEPLPSPWRQGRSDLADAYMRIGHRWRMWLSPECRAQRLRKEGIGKSTKPRIGTDEQQRTCTPRETGRYFALQR